METQIINNRLVYFTDGSVDARQFGIVSGVNQDQSANLQQAINTAASTGRPLTLPANSTYRILSPLTTSTNRTKIIGNGSLIWALGNMPSLIDVGGVIELEDIDLSGDRLATNCVRFTGSINSNGSSFTRVRTRLAVADGIVLDSSGNCNSIRFKGLQTSDNGTIYRTAGFVATYAAGTIGAPSQVLAAGTVAINGTNTITGTGTSFLSMNLRKGDLIRIKKGANDCWTQILSVNSNTSITTVVRLPTTFTDTGCDFAICSGSGLRSSEASPDCGYFVFDACIAHRNANAGFAENSYSGGSTHIGSDASYNGGWGFSVGWHANDPSANVGWSTTNHFTEGNLGGSFDMGLASNYSITGGELQAPSSCFVPLRESIQANGSLNTGQSGQQYSYVRTTQTSVIYAEWFGSTSTPTATRQTWQAAIDYATNKGGLTIQMQNRIYDLDTTSLSFDGKRCSIVGAGHNSGFRCPTGHINPILDFTGFYMPAYFRTTTVFRDFTVYGDSVSHTYTQVNHDNGTGSIGIKLGKKTSPFNIPMGMLFENVHVTNIGGPSWWGQEVEICEFRSCRVTAPIDAGPGNIPTIVFRGASNNNVMDFVWVHAADIAVPGTSDRQNTGNCGARGAVVIENDGTYSPQTNQITLNVEGAWPLSGGVFLQISGVDNDINLYTVDCHPRQVGAVYDANTFMVRLSPAVTENFGSNRLKANATWAWVNDTEGAFVDVLQNGNVLDLVRGFGGKCVRIRPNVRDTNVRIKGSYSGVSGTSVRNESMLPNSIVDETSSLINLVAPVTNCIGWWDVSRGLDVGYSAANGINGTAVDTLKDLSGLGQDLTSTLTKRPILAALNGRQALQFDGVNDVLKGLTFQHDLVNRSEFYLAAVVKKAVWGDFQQIFQIVETGNNRVGLGGVATGSLEGILQLVGQ